MAPRRGSATVTLPSATEILITRTFEAPRLLVWEALTTPRHLLRWWGPAWCPLVRCEIDLRPGGSWRYESRKDDGAELAWYGTYREIVAPERIVTTEVFEPFPEAEALNTMTLTEHDGVTTLQTLVRHRTNEARDGHVDSGMEGGTQDTFDRLDDLLVVVVTPRGRYRRAADGFGATVGAVPPAGWDAPTPCDGWRARDVVGHLTTWVPAVLGRGEVDFGELPSADDDPACAWRVFDAAVDRALADPTIAERSFDVGPPGTMKVAEAVSMLVTGDVLVHTWDLARATGLPEHLDGELVHGMLGGIESMGDALEASGHYGPPVAVSDDADEQTRLLALTGRNPAPPKR
jgi:uncharacterized protein (TIGR03086 family)